MSDIENVLPGTNDLVVMGSSAGGIEALSVLVSTLPKDFPAPIVIAQHLDPTRPSSLDTILQRRTNLPVEVVNDSSRLTPGKIYVVPSNRHVSIVDGHVHLQEDRMKRPRPSVDVLLSTAAQMYGEHLIAVILTGSGTDGAMGAIDVKNAGGTVIVQNPHTARYPSMPLALPPTVIDFEANIEQIGPLLYDLLTGVSRRQSEEKTEDLLRQILDHVSQQASIDFHQYKTSTILRRISRRMAVTHNRTMHDYARYLEDHPREVGELVKALLINVTQFFRDPEAFAYLRNEILPKLVASARKRDRVLRFWSAGCATGEEPYSLAMLLTDFMGAELPEWSIKIFGTDVDEAAINFARRGIYSETLLKGVPLEYRERFFERIDQGYRISKQLRQMVIFGQQDLSRSAPFPRIDLVLCRNVLIYFTPELQDYVLSRFAFSLYPHGYLFLGKAETVHPNQSYYELVNKLWKVYLCTSNALPVAARPGLINGSTARMENRSTTHPTRPPGKQHIELEAVAPSDQLGQVRRLNELLLRLLPVGVVVIDRSYQISTANSTARRLLGLHDLSNEADFLHSVRGIPYSTVRNTIDTVFRERNTVPLPEVELDSMTGSNARYLSFSIAPMQIEPGTPDLAVISIIDVSEQIHMRRQLETVQAQQSQLLNELSTSNKRLNDMNKELLDANEELQVANEELVLTHEELQATIEEFETTNEELQATNEELETNNEELQATNEELETTNDELRANTAELQELTAILESERVRLAEMVELAPFYIMVLRGPHLVVEAFNPRYARLIEGREIQDQPLEQVLELFWDAGTDMVSLAKQAYQEDKAYTSPRILTYLPRPEGEPVESYLVYNVVPSHDANGKASGVIIYAADETEQRAREAEEQRERLKLIFDNTTVAALALYDAQTAELIIGSPRYLDIVAGAHRLEQNSLIGRKWHELAMVAPGKEVEALWNTVLEKCTPVRLPEVHLKLTPDEPETFWDWSLRPIHNTEKNNIIRYMLVSAVEITEQVQARLEMERLNALKDEFLSLASHELRTPLTSISGNAELLQLSLKKQGENTNQADTQKSDAEKTVQVLDRIIYQANRMANLIKEMLDITRIRSDLFEVKRNDRVNLVAIVRQVVEQQAAIPHRSLTLQTSEEDIQCLCDKDRIEQVLNNLISNAFKYSPDARPVVVGIETRPGNADAAPHEAVIWVRDQGYGISPAQQEHIFDRFYRAQTQNTPNIEGLGLGLYIAREIITRHGGHMGLESKPDEGSTFYFSLPLEK